MPFSTDIYQNAGNQPSLASGLANSLNQFTEQRARLSDLARQRDIQQKQMEQQSVTQGYQNRALQRAEEAIPAQQAQAQRAQMEKIGRDIDLGIYTRLQSGLPKEEVAQWAQQAGLQGGLKPEQIQSGIAPMMQIQEPEKLLSYYQRSAMPQEYMKAELESQFRKPQAQSALANLMAERQQIAASNPNDPKLQIYDQMIEKTTTQAPQMQIVTSEGGGMQAVTLPKTPGQKATVQSLGIQAKAGKEQQLSAQAQKELFEADENAQAAVGVMDTLNQAKQLNSQAYSGYGALLRAKTSSNLPGKTDPKADATIQLDNLIREQALSSLKLTFGGSPTEGERAMLLELQASTEKTPEQRAKIIDKAISMADRKLRFNQQKAESLRGGSYFKEAPKTAQQEQTAPPTNSVTLPNGKIKSFPSAAAAQAFKKAAGIQ
jgi:hypothetical protein